jgi:hypothetical protein
VHAAAMGNREGGERRRPGHGLDGGEKHAGGVEDGLVRDVTVDGPRGSRSCLDSELLQQIPNTTPRPHKTDLLGEIDQFSCSNSAPIPPPIFVGHQEKNTHLPSNEGGTCNLPQSSVLLA